MARAPRSWRSGRRSSVRGGSGGWPGVRHPTRDDQIDPLEAGDRVDHLVDLEGLEHRLLQVGDDADHDLTSRTPPPRAREGLQAAPRPLVERPSAMSTEREEEVDAKHRRPASTVSGPGTMPRQIGPTCRPLFPSGCRSVRRGRGTARRDRCHRLSRFYVLTPTPGHECPGCAENERPAGSRLPIAAGGIEPPSGGFLVRNVAWAFMPGRIPYPHPHRLLHRRCDRLPHLERSHAPRVRTRSFSSRSGRVRIV